MNSTPLKLGDDVVEIYCGPRQAVELAHQQRVTFADVSKAALQLWASSISAAALFLEDVLRLAASPPQLLKLGGQVLPRARNPRIPHDLCHLNLL